MTSDHFADNLLSLPELARYLRVAERTLYVWAQQGKVPAFKVGSSWRFRRSEVDAWVESTRTGPVPIRKPFLTDPINQEPSPYRKRLAERKAEQAMAEDCIQEIEAALKDDERDVWAVEQFEERYGQEAVAQAIKHLRKDKLIVLGQEKGLRGNKVEVIRRR
jgi:excisionase family DNA binding protein